MYIQWVCYCTTQAYFSEYSLCPKILVSFQATTNDKNMLSKLNVHMLTIFETLSYISFPKMQDYTTSNNNTTYYQWRRGNYSLEVWRSLKHKKEKLKIFGQTCNPELENNTEILQHYMKSQNLHRKIRMHLCTIQKYQKTIQFHWQHRGAIPLPAKHYRSIALRPARPSLFVAVPAPCIPFSHCSSQALGLALAARVHLYYQFTMVRPLSWLLL